LPIGAQDAILPHIFDFDFFTPSYASGADSAIFIIIGGPRPMSTPCRRGSEAAREAASQPLPPERWLAGKNARPTR
jgi:hypothetical protein